MVTPSSESRLSFRRALVLSASLAMIASALEFVATAVFLATNDRAVYQGADVIWAKPVATLVGFLILGLVTWRLARSLFLPVVVLPVFAGPMLVLRPGSSAPLLILAAGLSYQAGRLLKRDTRQAGVVKAGRLLGAAYAMATVATLGMRFVRERMSGEAPLARGPNVLLLVLDTVRRPSLVDAGGVAATPLLESLAASGVTFERAVSPSSWTLPSHATMFTGLWPHEHGATSWESRLDDRATTLAEVFRDAGYRTGGFVANLIYGTREHGLDRGFEVYRDYPRTPGAILRASASWQALLNAGIVRRLSGFHDVIPRKHAEEVSQEFLDWVGQGGDAPWFAFLNYFEAHEPYLPRAPYAGRYSQGLPDRALHQLRFWSVEGGLRDWDALDTAAVLAEQAAYDESIAGLDASLRAMFAQLRARGELDNTLIIVTSDHGEQFGEQHGYTHGGSLYWKTIHVPLVMVWPGRLPVQRIPEPVSLRDLAATIQGLALPDAARLPGLPLVGSEATGQHSIALSELQSGTDGVEREEELQSVAGAGWQYIRSRSGEERVYVLDSAWSTHSTLLAAQWVAIVDSARSRLADAGLWVPR